MIKIATWNVNSLNVRLPHVLQWLADNPIDLLCLQELKLTDDKFPIEALLQAGYKAIFTGQKTYNGVAILYAASRVPEPTHITYNNPYFEDEQRRLVAATFGDLRVINGYFPNGQAPDSDKFIYKCQWLDALQKLLEATVATHPKCILTGDFNIAPADLDVHDPAAWEGKIHCTKEERQALQRLLALGFVDVWRELNPETQAFSWWDYRMAGFRRNLGLRIDHILATHAVFANIESSQIDKTPRTWEKPSDHTPVIASINANWSA